MRYLSFFILTLWWTAICLSAQPQAVIHSNPKSRSLWILRGDTCVLLEKSDTYVIPLVRGVFTMQKISGTPCDTSARVYSLKSVADPGDIAARNMMIRRSNDPVLPTDTVYVSISLPNYPLLRCVVLADGLYETFGRSGAGSLGFRQSKNTIATRGKISFSLFPVVEGQPAFSGRRTRYDFAIDADSSFNRVDVTLPAVTPTVIGMTGGDNETIILKGRSIFWHGMEYYPEPHSGGVAERLMTPHFRPPYVPPKRSVEPRMRLGKDSPLLWGSVLRGMIYVDPGAFGDLYAPPRQK